MICILLLVLNCGVFDLESSLSADSLDTSWFVVQVVDAKTRRGVPMVALRTTNEITFYTDSQGIAVIQEPGLMGTTVFFHIESHGYQYPDAIFGNHGVTLEVQAGKHKVIAVTRENIAERLYRITGQGIYRDSVLAGLPVPLEEPVLNGRVMGQDSVHAAVYRDKIYWIWGDTSRPDIPLGIFQVAGAVSSLPHQGGLDPSLGINLRYFTDASGFVRPICPIVDDKSILVWLDALFTVPDDAGEERLVAHYTKLRGLGEPIEHGIVLFDDNLEEFIVLKIFDIEEPWRFPQGQAAKMEENDRQYVFFTQPFPLVRVASTLADITNPASYEAFTCLAPGGRMNGAATPILRDEEGQLRWAWRKDTDPVGQAEERELVELGLIQLKECLFQLRDLMTGDPVQLHRASFHYNAYLNRWIMIGCEVYGRSFLGEVWFAEADSPAGPWQHARRIVTHDKYSFYNPTQHPFFDQGDGRYIYFEGTYTKMFSGRVQGTPQYEYNQIMYRLDVSDPRLRIENELN